MVDYNSQSEMFKLIEEDGSLSRRVITFKKTILEGSDTIGEK